MTRFAHRALPLAALAVALAIPSLASADDLVGNYTLSARYSNRRAAALKVRVEAAGYHKYRVERRSRFTSNRYRHLPEQVWTSETGELHGNLLVVRYSLDGASSSGIVGRLSANPSDAAMLAALQNGNVIRAIYKFSADRSEIREVAYNTTRNGDQDFWSWIKSSGNAVGETFRPSNASGRLSQADFNKATDDYIRAWYQDYLREGYAAELASASSAAERARIQANWDADKAEDPTEMVEGSELWDDSVDESYDTKDYYRDAQGRAIPREDVIAYEFSFFTNLAGIGLSKTLIFDRHTGELLEEGDIQD